MKRLLTAQTNYNVRVVFASINCGAPRALPATGLKMVRAYHTIKPCQITMHGNILETCFEEERADGGPLVMPDLDHEPAIGPEPVAGLGRDDAIRRQPIRPAILTEACTSRFARSIRRGSAATTFAATMNAARPLVTPPRKNAER